MATAASSPGDHKDKQVPAAMGKTDGAAKPAVDGAGSAAQPPASDNARKFSPLAHLTAQSARFGVWEVTIYHPTARTRQ